MKFKIVLLFSFIFINLSSCLLLYGIKKRPYQQEDIDNFLNQVDYDYSIVLKDSIYSHFYYAIDSCADSNIVKNLFQALQVHYLDANRNILSSKVNCFAKAGLTHLRWNLKGSPPPSDFEIKDCNQAIKNLIHSYPIQDKQYYVVVFWNLYMKKQSRHLIEEVQQSIERDKVMLILVNNDVWIQE